MERTEGPNNGQVQVQGGGVISLATLKKYVNKAAHTCPDKRIGLKKDHRNKKSIA